MLSTHFYGSLPPSYTYAVTSEEKLAALSDALQTSNGQFTNGVFNMTKALLKLIKHYECDYIAVCWDISRKTFRKQIYSNYKSHRPPTPLQLSTQFSLMQKVLNYMNVPQFKLDNYEADDLIGTLAARFSPENKVFILTKDRDALQLIDNNTTVWLNTKNSKKLFLSISELSNELKHAPSGYFPFSLDAFRLIYGLEPKQLVDLKGLVGDKSDGIPGIHNMGEKTATPILQTFGTIESFYNAIEPLDNEVAKQLLKDKGIKRVNPQKMLVNKEVATLSKQLATINTAIPSYDNLPLESLKFILNREKTQQVFNELEFYSLNF